MLDDYPTTLPQLFLAAADLLIENGLNKGSYVGEDGSLCLSGALHVAAGCKVDRVGEDRWSIYPSELTHDRGCLVVQALGHLSDKLGMGIPVYNDEYCPGVDMAIRLLKEAAEEVGDA